MHAKKKNKKAHKPPNPNPPQKLENTSKTKENIEEIQPKCEVEEQVLTPKVFGEIMAEPVSGTKEIVSETPNKPKRNKGNKKKQDKNEESIQNVEAIPQEDHTVLNVKGQEPVQEPEQEMKAEKKGSEEKKDFLEEISVVPSARKKKNKQKAQETPTEESKTPSEFSEPTPIEYKVEEVDAEIQELFLSKSDISKQDSKKKKNKKKNRSDSERSDKSDTAVSCTTAFQKLMVEDESLKQKQSDITAEGKQCSMTNISLQTGNENTEKSVNVFDSLVEIQLMDEIKEIMKDCKTEDIKELPKDESKGKKKNKKDRKQLQKELFEDPKPEVSHEVPITVDDGLPETVPSGEFKKDVKQSIEIPLDSEKERQLSPKPKAKIAKPVEKKKKGKQEAQSSEDRSNIGSPDIIKEGTKCIELFTEAEIKFEEAQTITKIESQISDEFPVIQKSLESMNVPSDNTMGKKRKKSPKPSKNKEVVSDKVDTVEISEREPSELEQQVKDSVKTCVSDMIQRKGVIVSSKPEEIALKISEPLSVKMLTPEDDQKMEKTEPKLLVRPLTPELKKDEEGFEIKTSKKKKKTPKVPQLEVSTEVKEHDIQKTDDKEKPTQYIEDKVDVPIDVSFGADLEMQSVKPNEIDALSCDAIPDVVFLRSSSQHLLDNNNNTVIQELINVDDIRLNDPLIIPFIEGSGETPTRTPELITSGIRMTEFQSKIPPEEKTDIKTKMMEVNQDMEELKLSIERSLAEFTAPDKCEKEPEKNIVDNILLQKERSPFKESDNIVPKNISVKKEESRLKDSQDKVMKAEENITSETKEKNLAEVEIKEIEKPSLIPEDVFKFSETPPVCPGRKDNKGKSKSKKKGKSEIAPSSSSMQSDSTTAQTKDSTIEKKEEKTEQKSEQKSEPTQEKGKQQSDSASANDNTDTSKDLDNMKEPINSELVTNIKEKKYTRHGGSTTTPPDFEPIDNFEDVLSSSIDDVNKTFEMIAKEADDDNNEFQKKLAAKPKINITEPTEDTDTNKNDKENPVSQPKNLLGQTDIPVQSNRTDYKKEKNKTPNARQARVKIKDSVDVEAKKESKESQTYNKKAKNSSEKSVKESFSRVKNDNEEYVYKYSFRKVFLQSACHVCSKDLKQVRVPCGYCNLVFYCGAKHKDEDWPQHQALCFAVSTLAHIKDQKHIYADAQLVTGQDYRLLRMQMIVSCEKILKRRLVPWEQEAMLYPRICADVACREWRQTKLKDCEGCGQLSYCAEHPDHLPNTHSRWCKSYCLYRGLVGYQQTKGRLEPRLPTKVMVKCDTLGNMNEALAALYEEKIDMNDIQYAALTQLATAPLTAAYCSQMCRKGPSNANGVHKKQPFTIHIVGAELQFEADALNKWETFFLHLRPEVEELIVVLISSMLNPGNLPLDLLGKIKLCYNCLQNKRRVFFKFEDKKNYFEYRSSEDFIYPDIICAFNASIQRSAIYDGKDPWPATVNSILKLKQPFIVTSYTLNELRKDVARVKQVADVDFKLVLEPGFNSFASVRPDRNFISDDEMPLLFKNYCVAVVVGC